MSVVQRPESERAAVAFRDAAVGELPAEIKQALELRKLQNQVAGQLASMSWGQNLDLQTRRAVADWGYKYKIDTATEIHVLGNNIYIAAAFYLRKLSELIASGVVEWAVADHIENDPRLTNLGPEGEGEYSRRLRERIRHNVPDQAASAVVFRVKLRSMTHEVTGCKAAGGGIRNGDPVGEKFPMESAETRAARRCMRQLASHVEDLRDIVTIQEAANDLSARVIAPARAAFKESQARIQAPPPGRTYVSPGSVPLLDPENPYSGVDESAVVNGTPALTEHRIGLRAAASDVPENEAAPPDPAQLDALTAAEPEDIGDDAIDEPEMTLDEANATLCPYGQPPHKRLSELTTVEIRNCYRMAERKGEHLDFRRAAAVVLEARS